MKDFIKWLGVNEKVAKVAVWMLIIMVFLIVTNTMLESIGFPHYAITYDNLKQVNTTKILEYIINWIIIILNFYSIILLVFKVNQARQLFKYSILYLILNVIITILSNEVIVQIFIILFFIIFSYLYSGKNTKYIFYAILSIIINIILQGIWYTTKIAFIDYSSLNEMTQAILAVDYFIIIGIIILLKEIYLKKRGAKNGPKSILDR